MTRILFYFYWLPKDSLKVMINLDVVVAGHTTLARYLSSNEYRVLVVSPINGIARTCISEVVICRRGLTWGPKIAYCCVRGSLVRIRGLSRSQILGFAHLWPATVRDLDFRNDSRVRLVMFPSSVVGGEHYAIRPSVRPSVRPLTPISRDAISLQLLRDLNETWQK